MKSHEKEKTTAPAKPHAVEEKLLGRFFAVLERFAYQHSWLVVAAALLLAALSWWYTDAYLKFKTNRRDLVSHDLQYEKLYQQYRQKFEDFDGLTVVIEGADTDAMKRFAETFVARLKEHPQTYSEIFYKVDVDYFRDKALLYLKQKELRDLDGKIRSHLDFIEKVGSSPGLNQLLKAVNAQISSGMVDTLMTDFFNDTRDKPGDEKDAADISLLTSILRQMVTHLKGDARYRSPWMTMIAEREESLTDQGYLASDNDSLMFIMMSPRENATDFNGAKGTVEIVRKIIAETKPDFPQIQVGVTGSDVIATDEMVTTQKDVNLAAVLSLVGCAGLFIAVYGGVVKPLLGVVCLIIAIIWTMGYATLTVGHLNILSVVFVSILIGEGIDFGIHMLERYREERALGMDVLDALVMTMRETGRSNFSGAVTTAIAFGSLSFTDFVGIAELGIIAGGGIILCFFAMIVVLPAMVAIEERWRKPRPVRNAPVADSNSRIEKLFDHYPWIIGGCLALTAVSLLAFPRLKFDYNLLHLQAKGTEAVQYELKILNNASRSTWYAAAIAPSLDRARDMLKQIESLPSIGKIESILSAIPEQQEEKMAFIATLAPVLDQLQVPGKPEAVDLEALTESLRSIRFKLQGRKEKGGTEKQVAEAGQQAQELLETLAQADPAQARQRLDALSDRLFEDYGKKIQDLKTGAHPTPVKLENLPSLLKRRYMSKNGEFLILVYPRINIWEREDMEAFLREMRKIDPNLTGNAVHMYESSQLMKNGYIQGGLYAMLVIIGYVIYEFRSLRTTFIVLLPTIIGGIWTVGLMELIDLHFNLANLIILPLIIGIGIVYGIHIVHRFQEEKEQGGVVMTTSTGQGVVLSALTTLMGFGSLMVADHEGIYSLGLVLTLGIGNAFFASLALMPAILRWCYIRGWKV